MSWQFGLVRARECISHMSFVPYPTFFAKNCSASPSSRLPSLLFWKPAGSLIVGIFPATGTETQWRCFRSSKAKRRTQAGSPFPKPNAPEWGREERGRGRRSPFWRSFGLYWLLTPLQLYTSTPNRLPPPTTSYLPFTTSLLVLYPPPPKAYNPSSPHACNNFNQPNLSKTFFCALIKNWELHV